MPILEDSIVLILSSDPKNPAFGTGFVIAYQQGYSYFLTCAHVLEQINKNPGENNLKISGLNLPIEIVCCGSKDAIDMALLKVQAACDAPLFEQFMLGSPSDSIFIQGYRDFQSLTQSQRQLEGTLGNAIKLTAQGISFPAWDINIRQKDSFSKLAPGYSGSPVYNSKNEVLGMMSHMLSAEAGYAICISNLLRLYPDAIKIIPALQNLNATTELEKLKNCLMQRQQEINEIYPQLIHWLDSVEDLEANKEAQKFIKILKTFLNGVMNGEDVADFFKPLLEKQPQKTLFTNALDYQHLARRLQTGDVVLCIGADLPKTFDPFFKPSAVLPQKVAELAELDYHGNTSMAEVCEQAQLNQKCTRFKILSELESLLTPPKDHRLDIPVYELLSQLAQPFLAIIGGFDTSLEQYLKSKRHKFVAVICNINAEMDSQRLIVEYPDDNRCDCFGNEAFSALQLMEKGYSIVYYPRGYPNQRQDTVLLAERDYFDSRELPNKRYPDYLRNKLNRSGLWFLGYHPDSWETRLLAKVLQEQRGKRRDDDKAIVIQDQADLMARLFWDYNRCNFQTDASLKEFVNNLKAAITL